MEDLLVLLAPFTDMALNIIIGLAILFVGLYVVKKLDVHISVFLQKTIKDKTVEKFLHNLIIYLLKGLIVLMAITKLGVETASLVAILGAAGFAIGLAFQGALSNFAGGILLLTLRPFNVGDFIEIDGKDGYVSSITILNTTIYTVDNKVVIIPNGVVANTNITNYTKLDTRRVDIVVGTGYQEDILKVRKVIESVVTQNEMILDMPETQIVVSNLNESSVDFTIKAWVKTENYWPVYYYLFEHVKIAFDKEGIEIPYNKLDINILK